MIIGIILAVTLTLAENSDKIKSYSAITFSYIHSITKSNSTRDGATVSEYNLPSILKS